MQSYSLHTYYLMFFLSGFASLVYQVVWQRALTLYYGVGSISTCIIVSGFVLGLGAGSLIGGYLAERTSRGLIIFAGIEGILGILASISPYIIDIIGKNTAGLAYHWAGLTIFILLLFPTFLMGMTLPLLVKVLCHQKERFTSAVAQLYFINTVGASFGTLFTAFILIGSLGLTGALWCAVFLDGVIIFMAIALYSGRKETLQAEIYDQPFSDKGLNYASYPLVFITGFLAIGYEILWFRIIGVLTKASPYSFSATLSTYLLGIALGSLWMDRWLSSRHTIKRTELFLHIQALIAFSTSLLLGLYQLITRHTSFRVLSQYSFDALLHPPVISLEELFQLNRLELFATVDIFLWPLFFIFLPAALFGASFPLIASLSFTKAKGAGRTVGTIYFFNTVGNSTGGIVTGFLLLPHLGTELTAFSFALVGVSIFIILGERTRYKFILSMIMLTWMFCFAPKRMQLYESIYPENSRYVRSIEEGVEGVVASYSVNNIQQVAYIDGLPHGGRPAAVFGAEALQAASKATSLEEVLIIGLGTGSTLEALLNLEQVKKVTLVEINRTLIKHLKRTPFFQRLLMHPKIKLVQDDARRFLQRVHYRYNLIIMDPLRTTTVHSNNLYSKQFFKLVDKHLVHGGIVSVWSDEPYIVPNTVRSVFPYFRMAQYKNDNSYFCLGSRASPLSSSDTSSSIQRKLKKFDFSERHEYSEEEMELHFSRSSLINTDWYPRAEYYLSRPR